MSTELTNTVRHADGHIVNQYAINQSHHQPADKHHVHQNRNSCGTSGNNLNRQGQKWQR
ncbi:Uncharacterised protein [Salmonella enterica subsp. arizonae]|nr:Uncharacterised protein [Salmonella enterica subsp. arizonae]